MILKSQGKTMSMGEFVGEALKLPCQYKDFDTNLTLKNAIEARHDLLLTPLTLCLHAVLPLTDFYKLSSRVQIHIDA